MSAPNISSYKDALRSPEHSLQQLSYLQPVPGVHDDFYFSSGNFAVVFKMKDKMDGRLKALKCFTRDQERRRESLHLISNYLNQIQSEYIIPYIFLEDEIWADGADHPVLLMDWIHGETLGEHVSKLCECHDRYGLERLCQEFARLSLWLLDQPWAHGDLKHDNILVWFDDSLVLIDYDGCFIPDMEGQNAREIGSPSFRHPMRTIKDFDPHLDDFSILVIFLSLRILVAEPALRQKQEDGENLVLSVSDITTPAASPLLERFRLHSDAFLKAGIALLDMAVSFPPGPIIGLREVLSKWLDEKIELQMPTPPDMVFIKGGIFVMGDVMGDHPDNYDETPFRVEVNDFYLAKKQLTFEEFEVFCLATDRELPSDSNFGRGLRPVINVDWYDAIEYCNWCSENENLSKVYEINKNIIDPNNKSEHFDYKKWHVTMKPFANGYRLPTEAEWEYAAREGGKKVRFGNGKNNANPDEINYLQGKMTTIVVGSLLCPNSFGLHDMSGNVSEWCWDWYSREYPVGFQTNYMGPISGSERVQRGGSYNSFKSELRAASRSKSAPGSGSWFTGFRLARTYIA